MGIGDVFGDVLKTGMDMASGNMPGAAMDLLKGIGDLFGGDKAKSSQGISQGLSALEQQFGLSPGMMGPLQQVNPQEMKHLLKNVLHSLEQQSQSQPGSMPFSGGGDAGGPEMTPGMNEAKQVLAKLLQEVSQPNSSSAIA